jgi:hypothetical protein
MERYYVRLGKRRTTMTMATIVSKFLALHPRVEPGDTEAYSAVRAWLQQRLDQDNDPSRFYVTAMEMETLAELPDRLLRRNCCHAFA